MKHLSVIVSGLLLLWLQFVAVRGFERITSGPGGPVCEDNFRKCGENITTCVSDKCQCPEGYSGKGTFKCFPPGYAHMSILNDPVYHTFTGEAAHMYYPCRYSIAHFITKFQDKPHSTCEVQILGFNKLVKGKYVVHGFDVALDISYANLTTSSISYRKTGSACNGVYNYEEQGTLNYSPDGPWEKQRRPQALDLYSEVARLRHDPYNNFAYLEVQSCGFRIDFRAYDTCIGFKQPQVPGLSVAVKSEDIIEWRNRDKFTFFVPGDTLKSYAENLNMGKDEALMYSLIDSRVEQNQPDGPEKCDSLYDILKKEDYENRLPLAMSTCFFMISSPLFVNCYDTEHTGDRVLPLFSRCVRSYKNKLRQNCEDDDNDICRCAERVNKAASEHYVYQKICCTDRDKNYL